MVCSAVPAARNTCTHRTPSSTAPRDGQASGPWADTPQNAGSTRGSCDATVTSSFQTYRIAIRCLLSALYCSVHSGDVKGAPRYAIHGAQGCGSDSDWTDCCGLQRLQTGSAAQCGDVDDGNGAGDVAVRGSGLVE